MDLLVNPPNSATCSDITVETYEKEVETNLNNLKEKAKLISEKLNTIKGFKCNEIEGVQCMLFLLLVYHQNSLKKRNKIKCILIIYIV